MFKAALLKSQISNIVADNLPRKTRNINRMKNEDQVNKILMNNLFTEVSEEANTGTVKSWVPFEDIGLTLATIRKKVPIKSYY